MYNQKQQLRKDMKKILLSLRDVQQQSEIICDRLISMSLLQDARVICCYQALEGEPNLQHLILYLLSQGKTIVVPKYPGMVPELVDLQTGESYGGPIHVFLVPGLAFTMVGDRLGRGGGRYDRILSRYSESHKIGVCFSQQILLEIPTQVHDIAMHSIISCA